jgi:hypothetical protein
LICGSLNIPEVKDFWIRDSSAANENMFMAFVIRDLEHSGEEFTRLKNLLKKF